MGAVSSHIDPLNLWEQVSSHIDPLNLWEQGLPAMAAHRIQRKQPSNLHHQHLPHLLVLTQPQRPAHFTSPKSKFIAAAGFAPTPYQSSLRVSTMNTPSRPNSNSEPINNA